MYCCSIFCSFRYFHFLNIFLIRSSGTSTRPSSSTTPGAIGERGSAPEGRVVGTLQHLLILSENSASQVPICAVSACRFDNPHQKWLRGAGRIPRSTSHFLSGQRAVNHICTKFPDELFVTFADCWIRWFKDDEHQITQ